MTNEDKASIARINELLTELKPLLYNLQEVIKPDCFYPSEPIVEPKEVVNEVEQERWRVEVMLRAGYRDDVKIVVTLNDGFISETSGKQLAHEIKQYLSKK
jgi:hypothetical protein